MNVMKKSQFFHIRAFGTVMCDTWIDPEDRTKGKIKEAVPNTILPKGGATICYLPTEDGEYAQIGVSICSDMDNYHKARGRGLAFSYAKSNGDRHPLLTTEDAIALGKRIVMDDVRGILERKRRLATDRYAAEMDSIKETENGFRLAKLVSKKKPHKA